MLFWTGKGWLVFAIWILAVFFGAGVLVDKWHLNDAAHLSPPIFVFLFAAFVSAATCWPLGRRVNPEKRPIYWRFSREKTIRVGRNTFWLMPIEWWAWIIPATTILSLVIFHLVFITLRAP